MVYITRTGKKAELAPRLKAEFGAVQGVSRVIEPADFASLGLPAPNERMGDMVLLAADRFAFDGATTGTPVWTYLPGQLRARTGTSILTMR